MVKGEDEKRDLVGRGRDDAPLVHLLHSTPLPPSQCFEFYFKNNKIKTGRAQGGEGGHHRRPHLGQPQTTGGPRYSPFWESKGGGGHKCPPPLAYGADESQQGQPQGWSSMKVHRARATGSYGGPAMGLLARGLSPVTVQCSGVHLCTHVNA